MHFEFFNSASGRPLGSSSTIDFGNIIQGQHCQVPAVFKAVADTESNVSNLKLYLTSKGQLTATLRYYIDASFIAGIEAGSNVFSTFTEMPDASSTSPYGVPVGWDSTSSYYVWLDIDTPNNQSGLNGTNFRLFFDHI